MSKQRHTCLLKYPLLAAIWAPHDPRSAVGPLLLHPTLVHIGLFDHVIVGGDDSQLVGHTHGCHPTFFVSFDLRALPVTAHRSMRAMTLVWWRSRRVTASVAAGFVS